MLTWIDDNPARHYGICGLFLAVLVVAAYSVDAKWAVGKGIGGRVGRVLRHPAGFLALTALALFAFRWPALYFPRLLDHDEAQMGAQALKYFTDIIPWRSVDGTTSGPLNSWWLMIPGLLGREINWFTIRFMGLVCVFGTVAFTYGTVRCLASETLARVVALSLFCFYAFAHGYAVLHYTSEHVPVLVLSGGFFFAVRARSEDGLALRWFVPSAVLFGAVPFAKLQPTPLGAFGAMLLLVIVIEKARGDRALLKRGIVAWIAGGASVPVLIMGMVTAGGALEHFWISYPGVLKTFKELGHPGGPLTNLLRSDEQAVAVVTAGSIVSAVLLVIALRRRGRGLFRVSEPFCWAVAYLGLTLFCVLWSGQNYRHYFLFLLHPGALCLATLVMAAENGSRAAKDEADARWPAGFLPWICLGAVMTAQLTQFVDRIPFNRFVGNHKAYTELAKEPVVQVINQVSRPGDRMTVWGMTPSYHVDSGLASATREAITQFQILYSSRQEYFRERFLSDFQRTKPKVFVDTDSPLLMVRGGEYWEYVTLPRHGHEAFPELALIIRNEYSEVYAEPIHNSEYKVRVYVRKN